MEKIQSMKRIKDIMTGTRKKDSIENLHDKSSNLGISAKNINENDTLLNSRKEKFRINFDTKKAQSSILNNRVKNVIHTAPEDS